MCECHNSCMLLSSYRREWRTVVEEGMMTKEAQKKQHRPVGGLVIAGASLALLFGIAFLKARVR